MTIQKLHARLKNSRISQGKLSRLLGMTEASLSRKLNKKSPFDGSFADRADAALTLLEESHTAGDKAKRRIEAKWSKISERL